MSPLVLEGTVDGCDIEIQAAIGKEYPIGGARVINIRIASPGVKPVTVYKYGVGSCITSYVVVDLSSDTRVVGDAKTLAACQALAMKDYCAEHDIEVNV